MGYNDIIPKVRLIANSFLQESKYERDYIIVKIRIVIKN